MTVGRRRLARGSRRSGNRHSRARRRDDRSTRGSATRCTLRTRRARRAGGSGSPRSHRSHRSHRGRSTCGVIAGVLWITRTSVFATGTTELGSGMTVRVHVAIGVRVGAIFRPGGRRPAHWDSQRGRRHQTDDHPLHSITPIALAHCSYLGTFAAFAPLHVLKPTSHPTSPTDHRERERSAAASRSAGHQRPQWTTSSNGRRFGRTMGVSGRSAG
jgi:hypothetical protein